jgi:hypothetical protein
LAHPGAREEPDGYASGYCVRCRSFATLTPGDRIQCPCVDSVAAAAAMIGWYEHSWQERPAEVARQARRNGRAPEPQPEPVPALRLVPLAEFAATDEATAEALLGTDDDAAFTAGDTVMTYGGGGQAKTTLTIDGIAHLAAGVTWLGFEVARPLRVVLLENEGPRGSFRRKLRRKLDTWEGPPFAPNVLVVEEPWAAFTFSDDGLRSTLADACAGFEADMLVIGPLVTIGAEGGGTPEEVARFERLLAAFRVELGRPLLVWLVHHENKSGDVSGAWERLPDTLMRVRGEGRGRTLLHWQKARWCSALHDQRWTLHWLDECEGFERVDAECERDVRAEIVALGEADPERWRTATEIAAKRDDGGIGRQVADVKQEIEALVSDGHWERATPPPERPHNTIGYRPASLDRAASKASKAGAPPEAGGLTVPASAPVGGRGPVKPDGRPTTGLAERQSSGPHELPLSAVNHRERQLDLAEPAEWS